MQPPRSHCVLAVDGFVCGLDITHGQQFFFTIIRSPSAFFFFKAAKPLSKNTILLPPDIKIGVREVFHSPRQTFSGTLSRSLRCLRLFLGSLINTRTINQSEQQSIIGTQVHNYKSRLKLSNIDTHGIIHNIQTQHKIHITYTVTRDQRSANSRWNKRERAV